MAIAKEVIIVDGEERKIDTWDGWINRGSVNRVLKGDSG